MSAKAANVKTSKSTSVGLRAIWESAAQLPRLSKSEIAKHLLGRALSNIKQTPLTAILTTLTIGMALFLLGSFILFVENVQGSLAGAQSDLLVSFYLKDEATPEGIQRLAQKLRARPEVDAVAMIDKQMALKAFRATLDKQAYLLEGVESQNPLPASLEVKLKSSSEMEAQSNSLVQEFGKNELVEHALYSNGLMRQVAELLRGARLGGALVIVLMLAATVFIISNTIKLALYSHRQEIEIMRLVGATDWFIRAPYLFEGAMQGLVGAVLSIFMVKVLFAGLRSAVEHSDLLRQLLPQLEFFSLWWCMAIILTGILVGLCGSYLTLRRFSLE